MFFHLLLQYRGAFGFDFRKGVDIFYFLIYNSICKNYDEESSRGKWSQRVGGGASRYRVALGENHF